MKSSCLYSIRSKNNIHPFDLAQSWMEYPFLRLGTVKRFILKFLMRIRRVKFELDYETVMECTIRIHSPYTNNHRTLYASFCCKKHFRPEIFALRGMLQERDTTISMLRADLEGVRAQLSDLRGELTEAQKEEIEYAMDFGEKTQAELASTRSRLAQMNDMMTGLRNQLQEKETELRYAIL